MAPLHAYEKPSEEQIKEWLRQVRMGELNIFDDRAKIISNLCIFSLQLIEENKILHKKEANNE